MKLLGSNSVKYIGQERDYAKTICITAGRSCGFPTDVVLRGEKTAEVLNLHRVRLIRYIPSAAFGKTPLDTSSLQRSLEAAVSDWLKSHGAADTAHSFDKGKLGHELKVINLAEGGPTLVFTHVGVGASRSPADNCYVT